MSSLSIVYDHAQSRLKADRIAITGAGMDWNGLDYSNTWIDPVSRTLMLRPMCLKPDWHTQNTGIYSRLGLSSFSLGDPWKLNPNKFPGQQRLFKMDGMGMSSAVSVPTYAKNRGFFVSFFPFNVGNNDDGIFFDFGWGTANASLGGVWTRFWAGGTTEIWKDGAQVGVYTLGHHGGHNQANSYQDILLLPMRKRELLVYSITGGEGFVHVFEDIDETDTDPTITPAGTVAFYVPGLLSSVGTASVDVEIAPVQFETSGYATTIPFDLARAPEVGRTLETWTNVAPAASITDAKVVASGAYAGTTEVTAVTILKPDGTAFTPDGTQKKVILKVEMTGDGAYTPFLYSVHAAYEAQRVDTDDTEAFEVLPFVKEVDLSIPDDPAGVEMNVTLSYPEWLDANGAPQILTVSNRPVSVKIGTQEILDGRTLEPKYTRGITDDVQILNQAVRDGMEALRRFVFKERVPCDGWDLCKPSTSPSLIRFIFERIGIQASDMTLEDVSFPIATVAGKEVGKNWNFLIEVGDTALEVLTRAHRDFCASFIYGLRPKVGGIEAFFLDPLGLSGTPDITLYPSAAEAIADGVDPGDADDLLYWSYNEVPLEVEANIVRMTGFDIRTHSIIQAFKEDGDSIDPTVKPSLRVDNWLGEPREFAAIDPAFTTLDACEHAVDQFFPILTGRNYVGEWDCNLLLYPGTDIPLWRGALVKLVNAKNGEDRMHRISSAHLRFIHEPDMASVDQVAIREASYTGGTLTNGGGRNLAEIQHFSKVRAKSKTIKHKGWEELVGQQTQLVEVVP